MKLFVKLGAFDRGCKEGRQQLESIEIVLVEVLGRSLVAECQDTDCRASPGKQGETDCGGYRLCICTPLCAKLLAMSVDNDRGASAQSAACNTLHEVINPRANDCGARSRRRSNNERAFCSLEQQHAAALVFAEGHGMFEAAP